MSNRVSRHSKRLSYLLRHSPESGNLVLDAQGWAPVAEVLASTSMSLEDLAAAVEQNDKNRFEWDRASGRIRARQGHSVAVDLELEPVEAPARLFHGTVREALPAIFTDGLRPMTRIHVHLSSTVEVAANVAGRRSRGDAVLLEVDGQGLVEAGFPLYCSTNGVYLTPEVPARFLREIPW